MRNFFVPFGLKPKPPEEGPYYADSNDRSLASAVDLFILFYLLGGISQRLTHKVFSAFEQSPLGMSQPITDLASLADALWVARYPWLISNGLVVLLMGVFIVGCQMLWGTTPGKRLLGLKIVRNETFEPIARWRFILRFLGYIPACLPLMIGVFWMLFNKKKRGWHDYIAGTVVITTRPRGWYYGKFKQGLRWLRQKLFGSVAIENTVAEPTAEQGHKDGTKPID